MNKIAELFGRSPSVGDVDWSGIVADQECPFIGKRCYKVRKSDPKTSIGSCTVLYGRKQEPILICPARLLERRQVFTDCLHLLTQHEPGNELHIVNECPVPGGSVDHVLVSAKDGRVVDFAGIEIQTLDTTGTVWPERQRLLRELGVPRGDGNEDLSNTFGINWKMTAKTILMQIHHKIETFEHVNKKMALAVQDRLLEYMVREFNFSHLKNPAVVVDSMHVHAYDIRRQPDGSYRAVLASRLSTDMSGIAACLNLRRDPKVGLAGMVREIQTRISPATLFAPV